VLVGRIRSNCGRDCRSCRLNSDLEVRAPLVSQFEGTLDQFSGDGIMVFFNDPVPIPDPTERAVRMAGAMGEAASTLIAAWRERSRELGFGAGIAQGYATCGQIGFSERSGYIAIGRCAMSLRVFALRLRTARSCSATCQCRTSRQHPNRAGWRARFAGPRPAGGGLQRTARG